MIDFKSARAAFEEYLKEYDRDDDKIRLKIVHTYCVVDCVENIARRMGLPREDRELGMLIGLLHDIGRFEQIKRYDSFMPDTMDHAAYGAALLFGKQKMIRRFIEDDRWDGIIETAIARHSDFSLEGVEGEQKLLHARLIRDGDKLDNCRVKLEESLETLLGISAREPLKGKLSPAVWEACLKERSVLSADRRTKPDYWASYLAQLYDVNFPATFSIILEENYVPRILSRLQYEDEDTRIKMKLLSENLQAYMRRQTGERN